MKGNVQRAQRWSVLLTVLFNLGIARAQLVANFDDIQFWVGEGANRAAVVIDWNDGKEPESLVWGYRWDGSATGLSLLQAVTAADPRFGGVTLTDWGWGWTVDGLGYDLDGDGFDLADEDDHYKPGWNPATWEYWAYFTYDGSSNPWTPSQDWTYSMVGMADRPLSDGSWDGWRYSNTDASPRQGVAAIPEPASVLLLAAGSAVAWIARRRNRG